MSAAVYVLRTFVIVLFLSIDRSETALLPLIAGRRLIRRENAIARWRHCLSRQRNMSQRGTVRP
jgi:hypothetical protein